MNPDLSDSRPNTSPARQTILVVEDDPMVRRFVGFALEEMGYSVLVAESPEEAFALAEEDGEIDLLLTDVILPQMDGRAVAGRLKMLRPGLPVLYMSGYTDEILAPRGILEKGINYLPKPFSPDSLECRVRESLGKRKCEE